MRTWFSFLKPKDRSSPACVCQKCSSTSLKRTIATYPVPLAGSLAGRRVDVYRVEMDRCRQCGHLMPTPAGQAKIKRCVKVGKKVIRDSILNALPSLDDFAEWPPITAAKPKRPSQIRNRAKSSRKPSQAAP